MGFLSSLFGVSDRTPETSTNVVSTKLPDELAPFVTDVLGEAQDLYKGEIERGYDPYTGQTIAPLTAEEQQAMAGIAGLAGTTAPFLQEGLQTYRQGAEKFTGDTAQQYMSPYQQAVTDIEKREATRNFEGNVLPRLEAQAVGAGAMSGLGSRAGVEFSEAQRNQSQLLADIQAKGQQKAFQDARQGFEQQKAREAQMAGNVARTGPALFQAGLAEQGALQTVGEQKRQLGQSALDEAYGKFLEEKNFPKQSLSDYSSTIYGSAPSFKTGALTGSTTGLPGAPSTGQQLLGLGLQGLNVFGAGGGFSPTGFQANNLFSRKREGGQIGEGLSVINRRIGGGLGDDEQGFPMDSDENIGRFIRETEEIQDRPIMSDSEQRQANFFTELERLQRDLGPRNKEKKDIISKRDVDVTRMIGDANKRQTDLSDASFNKREAAIKERREKYPFASIAKGIAAGMKEPTIAMMFTQGIAVTGEELEAKANQLDNMIDALEQQKFGAKSKEESEQSERLLNNVKESSELQLKLLELDTSTQLKVLELMAKGLSYDAARLKAGGMNKGDKITQPYLNDRNSVIRSALKFQGDFKLVDGKAVFTGKNDKGQNLTGDDYRKIAEVEAKYDGYYNAARRSKRTPSEAAEYAKEQLLKDTQGTNISPPPPPPPSGNNATIPKPKPTPTLAPVIK